MERQNKPVITGMGCLSAAGNGIKENLLSLHGKVRNHTLPTRFCTDHDHPYPVFEVQNNLSRPSIPTLNRTCLLLLKAAQEAVSESSLKAGDFFKKKVGVCIGTSVGSTLNNIDFYDEFRSGRCPDLEPVHRYLSSNPAACLANEYKLSGPVQTVVNTCASGTDAIGIASSWIAAGLCDIALAGGADELSIFAYNGFASLQILDTEPSRPFDVTRNGLNLGEGAGLMVLESSAHARARKCKFLGRVLGHGTACDGHHLISPHPKGVGLKLAINQALEFGKVKKREIAFINAHGTGTRANDRVESMVLDEMLTETPFFSTKGCTGHTLGAAGAIEAVFTIACLNQKKIPPSLGFTTPAGDTPGQPIKDSMEIHGNIALSQSLAFGGNNAVLIFEGGEK